jgi:undecaprenyl-diphosphatase
MFDKLLSFDYSVILFIHASITNGFVIGVSNFFTIIGNYGLIWVLFLTLLSIHRKERILLTSWTITFLLNFVLLVLILKNIVQRDRPFIEFPQIILNTIAPGSYSFPSNHASLSGASFYIFWKFSTKRLIVVLIFLLSLAISLSRVVLKVHYPTDVIVGYLLGSLIAFFTVTYIVSFKRKRVS